MTPDEARMMVRALLAAWPDKTIDEDVAVAYGSAFLAYEVEEGREAVAAAVRAGGEFFPPLGNVAAWLTTARRRRASDTGQARELPTPRSEMQRVGREGLAKARAALGANQRGNHA